MVLSQRRIQELLDTGEIKITPEVIMNDASIKIHISTSFAKPGKEFAKYNSYILKPKEFILALSKEKITLSENYAGLYDGYTHLARRGIITHLGSMFVDPKTDNQITLEIFNASDQEISLKKGMRVGHLVLLAVDK